LTDRDKKDGLQADDGVYKSLRSGLDEIFLSLVDRVMKTHGIKSASALSKELGKGVDFISKIRRGLQSAPADAWDALFEKYPETRNITNTNVTSQGGGQAVGTVHGDNHYSPTNLEVCQLELEQHKRDLANLRAELEKAQQQIASQAALLDSKDALLASRDEIISLLRGGYNRPN
jgi:hypothetical protein